MHGLSSRPVSERPGKLGGSDPSALLPSDFPPPPEREVPAPGLSVSSDAWIGRTKPPEEQKLERIAEAGAGDEGMSDEAPGQSTRQGKFLYRDCFGCPASGQDLFKG